MKLTLSFLTAFMLVSTTSQAAQIVQAAPIKFLEVTPQGGVQVGFSTDYVTGSMPSCTTYAGQFFFDATTTGGQNMYRLLLTAQVAGLKVVIDGSGSCNYVGNTEGVSLLFINTADNQ